MNQFALTKSIDTYLKHNNLTMIEQSSWNNGVVVFKIEDGDGLPKSLVVIYLEKDELHLKDMVKQLMEKAATALILFNAQVCMRKVLRTELLFT